MNITEAILNFMREKAYKPTDIKELEKIFGIKKDEKKEFKKILRNMEKDGQVVKTRTNKYGVPERMGLVVGKFQGHQKVMDS